MRTPNSESSLDQAQQVCTSCKARKRKCDKALPRCSQCTKRNLTCEYSTLEQSRNSASVPDRPWHGIHADEDRADAQSLDFPTMLFLDPGILQHGQVDISCVAPPVPAHILQLLGDIDEIRATASKFFEHIHMWMPFISKKRFHELHLRSFQSQPDIALLLVSLKLITTLPPVSPRNPRTPLYYTAKHFYLEVEGSSIFSIPILQAGILIALYELGQAIYPAAYLSIGACARYAHAHGINVGGTLNTRRAVTLIEVEERRRVWWAIVILDRFVNVGCPGRPFATADPSLDDFLPADDAVWDQGIVRSDDSFRLSSPMTAHMSKFALLCQAARLLGQVLRHVSSESAFQDDVWMQLDRTLHSMLAASHDMDEPDYDQITFIYSALVALYMPSFYAADDTDRSQRARVVIRQINETVSRNLVRQRCFIGRDPEAISPWGLFFAYHLCGAHIRYGRGIPELVKILRETFTGIDARWNAAGVYLQLLEAREVMSQS
ncbi:putative fungal-specific transcription factor [Mytilinidion resinicola]|uniref:Fungal-specific transcription factor n=1 Tax=Mytilinidion resinicola TaxID=574789 RepID=A0A6A6Y1Z1_9PEZI|nr:putative fungal-specific transcription factor [Mytilinidion resinicola]KAF2801827.1 putative fungal-specific transcription factor [Mytilinidion resinicola]